MLIHQNCEGYLIVFHPVTITTMVIIRVNRSKFIIYVKKFGYTSVLFDRFCLKIETENRPNRFIIRKIDNDVQRISLGWFLSIWVGFLKHFD